VEAEDVVTKNGKDNGKKNLLDSIMKVMDEERLDEIEVWDGDSKIKLSRQSSAPMAYTPVHAPAAHSRKKEKAAGAAETVESGTPIKSPLAGVFYRSPSPQAPPFVKEGDVVSPDKTVCIVEAMKVLNQINAGVSGKIIKVCVENGKPISSGQILFYVESQ
jgi:acetyl-CoA carboxylase biotin carboxyl carrier protein